MVYEFEKMLEYFDMRPVINETRYQLDRKLCFSGVNDDCVSSFKVC